MWEALVRAVADFRKAQAEPSDDVEATNSLGSEWTVPGTNWRFRVQVCQWLVALDSEPRLRVF